MILRPGTQVFHLTHGPGTVAERTAHTLPDHERVEFTVQEDGKPSRQVRLRVRRADLTVQPTEGWYERVDRLRRHS